MGKSNGSSSPPQRRGTRRFSQRARKTRPARPSGSLPGPAAHPGRRTFLLRCWQEAPADWRFILEETHTRQRQGCAGLGALLELLQAELAGHEIDFPGGA